MLIVFNGFNPEQQIERGKRFLALGDSYTIGESVDSTDCWPVQLVDSLNRAGYNFADPHIIARTGWTTGELLSAINQLKIKGSYNLVSLLIGVNNQYRGLPLGVYRSEFIMLLNKAVHFAADNPERVLVLSIPDWGATPYAADGDREKIAREIDTFNLVIQEETRRRHISYIDITLISRQAKQEPGLVARDRLHPSAQMYTRWIDLLLPEVKKMLSEAHEQE